MSSYTYKRNFVYCFIIMALLFGTMGWNVYCLLGIKGFVNIVEDKKFSEIMGRVREYYVGPRYFFTGDFQKHLENATSDRFPFAAILEYRKVERWFAKMALGILPSSWTPLLPIGGNYLLLKANNVLLQRPEPYIKEKKNTLSIRSDYYNKIIKENPSINLFVFPVLHKHHWVTMGSDYLKTKSKSFVGDQYVNLFHTFLDTKIGYSWGGRDISPDRNLMLYYKTDHHFNMTGSYIVYNEVINLIRATSKDISEPLQPDGWFSIPKVEFRGSYSRRAGGYEPLFDLVEDAKFNLPDFQVLIDGVNSNGKYNGKLEYLSGSIPSGLFINHYGKYFGDDHGCLELINNSRNSRNLLVISDSFDNAIVPLLSSHYSHAIFIDLRLYKNRMGISFNLQKIVNDNKIDDVLFFGAQSWLLDKTSTKEE